MTIESLRKLMMDAAIKYGFTAETTIYYSQLLDVAILKEQRNKQNL